MRIKLQTTELRCKKSLHPSEIRTYDLLFCCAETKLTTPRRQGNYEKNLACGFFAENAAMHEDEVQLSVATQCDQIGRFFALWVVVYFGEFIENY
jgi:hypothetical protein